MTQAAPRKPIRCPRCGAPMNFHAEKVDRSGPPSPSEPRQTEPTFPGVVLEIHACPACGATVARRADES